MVRRQIPVKKVTKAIVLTVAGLTISYCVIFGWMVYTSPLTYSEMDINHDGKVEFFEANYASSYGANEIEKGGMKCTEFYAYKDGLPLKVVCKK
jgi:hypothetical protein